MSTRVELHQLVDKLDDADAEEALALLHELVDDSGMLTDDELASAQRGDEEIRGGDYATLADLRRRLHG